MPASKLHPTYAVMITKALQDLRDSRNGSSLVAVRKYIVANYRVPSKTFHGMFLVQVKRLTAMGYLIRDGQRIKLSAEAKADLKKYATYDGMRHSNKPKPMYHFRMFK